MIGSPSDSLSARFATLASVFSKTLLTKRAAGTGELVELFQTSAVGWLVRVVFIGCRWGRNQFGRLGSRLNRGRGGLKGLGLKRLGYFEVGNAGQEDALQFGK